MMKSKNKSESKFKLKWNLKVTLNAPVILTFVAASFVILILSKITLGVTNKLLFMTYRSSLLSPLTYVRLFTHVLGHSDLNHFIGNMSYFLLLGPMLEEKYGHRSIVSVICITATITGLVNSLLFPTVALCGASGVVFAFILMTSFTGFKKGEIPLTFILIAIFYLGQQVYNGIALRDNISNLSHIIGGIVGSVVGYQFNQKPSKK